MSFIGKQPHGRNSDCPKTTPCSIEKAALCGQSEDRAGVTTAKVASIERDEIEPRMTTLPKLAQGLGVDPAELVD
jgi:Helix-turn-helix